MIKRKKKSPRFFDPQDHYFMAAKAKGYKSRAAFKLLEIVEKFQLVRPGQRVLDLGAAPGGWSQVALQAVGTNGQVIGIDLQEVTLQAPNYLFIKGDLLDPATWAMLPSSQHGFNVVLSDMAPATSGIKFQDQARSAELVWMAWGIAKECLQPKGHFVAKLFPGEELATFKKALKNHFEKIQEIRPHATRKTSNEVYLVGIQKRPAIQDGGPDSEEEDGG